MEESKVFENENTDFVETEGFDVETNEEGGSLAMALAVLGGIGAAVVAGSVWLYKKVKSKKGDKPKVKKRLRWVEVDDNEMIDVDVINETEFDEDIEETA